MQIHLDHELDALKKELTIMCNRTVESLIMAIRAIKNNDQSLAQQVIRNDHEIDMQENKIDGMLLAILGLQQTFAVDLRFLTAAMKINNDLERVADKSVSIARAAQDIAGSSDGHKEIEKILEMGSYSLDMIKKAFNCFISKDVTTALEVITDDKDLDEMNSEIYKGIIELISMRRNDATLGINIYKIAASLERIGDLAKNISEEVIYYVKGEIVKHQLPEE